MSYAVAARFSVIEGLRGLEKDYSPAAVGWSATEPQDSHAMWR
jgi:hypothetical protein